MHEMRACIKTPLMGSIPNSDPQYQMILVSATIGKNVMEFPKSAFVKVDGNLDSKTLVNNNQSEMDASSVSLAMDTSTTVGHWHVSSKSSIRSDITSNPISVLLPRLTIVFVPKKSDTERVASFLSEKAGGATIRILHGDMSQTARTSSGRSWCHFATYGYSITGQDC